MNFLQWPPEPRQDEMAAQSQPPANIKLVDYPDDDDDEVMDAKPEVSVEKPGIELPERGLDTDSPSTPTTPTQPQNPPERLSEKRRRDDEDDDELVRLAHNGPKRRSSNASSTGSSFLRRRRNSVEQSFASKKAAGGDISKSTTPKKIAINLSPSLKSAVTVEAEAIQISDIESTGNDEPKDDRQNEKGG